MSVEQAKQATKRLLQQLEQASNQKLQKRPSLEKTFYDFQAGKASYHHSTIEMGLKDVRQQLWSLCRHYEGNEAVLGKLIPLLAELGQKDHDLLCTLKGAVSSEHSEEKQRMVQRRSTTTTYPIGKEVVNNPPPKGGGMLLWYHCCLLRACTARTLANPLEKLSTGSCP